MSKSRFVVGRGSWATAVACIAFVACSSSPSEPSVPAASEVPEAGTPDVALPSDQEGGAPIDATVDASVDAADAEAPAPTCTDGVKNGPETDIDCGGTCTAKCADTKTCAADGDCTSTFCNPTTTQCVAPACDDTFKNGSETDKDCGGSCTTKCEDTFACAAGSDCKSGSCNGTALKCEPPTCGDSVQNGTETDKDCGGTCATKCADSKVCKVDGDCQSTFCHPTSFNCVAPACDDGFVNGTETDKDCGGSCATKCGDDLLCKADGDCTSGFCNPTTTKCAAPACDDGFVNGTETDKDCGGSCSAKCVDDLACKVSGDCAGGFCNPSTLKCATPGCGDGFQNGNETAKDCGGGTCSKCDDALACKVHGDCANGFCHPPSLLCASPACNDGFQNGSETAQDCGGSCGTKCDDGAGCNVAGDCKSSVCAELQCQTPACDDGVRNGTEADVDCGGTCKNCPTTVPTVGDLPTLKDSLAFLYTGANAVQTGLTATIDPVRVSVIRGRVALRDGTPLDGVTVSLKNRAEFGTTKTQADGAFDLVVNGGGGMTLEYQKSGVLPSTRVIEVPWHDFVNADDVVMVPLDTAVTTVDFTAPVVSHQGTMQSDDAGDRQATLLFTEGTVVTMTMPNGTTQPLALPIHVRATEFTVGPSGPDAMPGPLPSTSGYTYAAEFSVDEAMAAGASSVNFSKPVVTYVDNFLKFPVGSVVPAGYFDRDKDAWVGSKDGRAIKIESVTGGMADLVVDKAPAGIANATRLGQLGITDQERTELAVKFAVGKELWRVVVDHFTPWDYNWPKVPEAGSRYPNLKPPKNPNGLVADCDECDGSIIEAQNQTLGETLPLVGTSEALHYRSDRSLARLRNSLTIPITEATVPASLRRVDLKISVAGRTFTPSINPPLQANQTYTFNWDGVDAWGRPQSGAFAAKIKVSHVYRALYAEGGSGFGNAFGALEKTNPAGAGGPTGIIEADRTRNEIKLSQEHKGILEAGDVRRTGLGGWSLSSHHQYFPDNKELLFGDGRRRMADAVTQNVVNFQARVVVGYRHSAWTMGPDGTIYFREYPYYGSRIWKRSPQGAVTPLIGSATMSAGCGAAGLPGSQTQVANSVAMAISPLDGLLYYAQADNGCPGIRRLRADGVVENVTAPSTAGVESGVGGPASAAQLPSTAHIVFGADGTLYIAAGFSSQPVTGLRMTGIYTIAPDGILRRLTKATQAGSESQPYCYMTEQNNIPLANATWPTAISYIDVDKDGRILFSQQCSIKKVENGIVTTVAGAGYGPAGPFCGARCAGSLSMGVNALSADASGPDKPYSDAGARAVAWDGRGGFYFATAGGGTGYGESQGDRIRHVTAEGIVESYMGDGTLNIADNSGRGGGMPASALKPGVDGAWIVGGMKLGPDGALYVGNILPNYQGGVITRVSPFLPGFTGADLAVPSESGNEVYVFNSVGRHLRTVSNTNVTLQTFGYDSAGRLTSITDRSGNVVTIERNASGQMTAIVAPGGQRNTLTVDGNGYLTAVANPAGQAYALGYAPGGLLASLTDPRAGVHSYEYDGLGYLVKDTDPAGAATTLARAADGTVTLTNALGLTQSFAVATAGSLTETRTSTAPSGAMTTTSTNTAGVTTSTDSVGDTMTTRLAPDARFGMSSPYASNVSVATPLGTVTTTFSRQLTVPDLNNPFSLTAQTDSFTVNGRTSTMTYTVGTRTGVSTTAGGSGSSRRATIVLDALLRPIQETREVGQSPVTYSYRADGLVQTMTQGATSTALAYDSARRLTTRTNAIGQRVKVTYDSADRVSAMTYAETTPVAQDLATFQYAYDANGNRTSVTMPSGAVHGFAYDARDLVTSYTPPDGSAMALAYDGIKRLSQLTLGDGRNVSFSYDAAGRMTGTTFPEGSTTRSYVGATERLASAVRTPTAGAAQSIAFTYAGSALTGLAFAGPATGAYAFTYDVPSAGATNLWVASRSLDGGPATPFAYDADGLTTVEGPFGLTRSGPRGATSAIRIGATTHWTYGYDALGRRTSRVLNAAGSRYSSTLSFDAGSQLTGRVESVNGAAASTYAYKYDGRGQLVEVKKDNVVVESYAYDVNGNRTSALVGGNPVTTTYDAQDRIVTRDTTAYTYDAAGFLTQRGSDTFVYSARGELLSATVGGNTVTYGYDAGGRRVARTDGSGTTEYLYSDGSFYVTHSRAPGGMVTEYFYDDAGRLYALRRGGTNYLVGTDEVGTPKIVVDAAGVVALTAEYDAWGVALGGDANTFDIPQGFAGGLRDATTGLVRFGYRDYEPASGRWTARDPMGFSGGTNLFAYIANAPTLVRDPSGLEPSSEHYWRSYEYRLINNFEAIPKDAAEYTVGIHGGENGQFWAFNQWVSPEVLAAMIKGRLGFRPGMPIRLVACWSGRSGAAQALANALLRETGVPSPVIAPDNLAVLPSDGKVYSGVEGGYGDYVPIVPSGDFRTYWPSVNPRLAR